MNRLLNAGLLTASSVLLASSGCETLHGPRSFTLTPEEIERRIEADLGASMEVFRGLELRRPEVTLMPVSGRLQLAWNVTLPGSGERAGSDLFSTGLGVTVALSGRPALNVGGDRVDLKEVQVEDVRFNGLPRLFGLAQLADRKGSTLGDMPLMALTPGQLRKFEVIYQATAVEVTYRGLRIDIAPK